MDEKEKNRKDDALEQLLDMMDDSSNLTDEELDRLLTDSSTAGNLRDITDCKDAVRRESPLLAPNVEKEWGAFRAKRTVVHRHAHNRFMWGTIVGVAATLALVVVFSLLFKMYKSEGITVCTASNDVQQITLRTSGGQNIPIIKKKDTSELRYAKRAKKREIHVLSTPRGQDFKLELADGTVVWLNSESRIEYPTEFSGKERVVKVYGEAYFKVAHDKRHPFIVRAGGMQTRVLGTEFNIRSYEGADSHVTLISGSVEVKGSKNRTYTRIRPGEDAAVGSNGAVHVKDVDVDGIVYWKDGYFYFDNVPFKDIMQSLGHWYNVNVVFQNEEILDYRLHYLCDRNSGLDYAVKLLNKMNKISVKVEGNTVIVQ
jgi:ferric-dicitrate binding protein FerR (iron transport regulator)